MPVQYIPAESHSAPHFVFIESSHAQSSHDVKPAGVLFILGNGIKAHFPKRNETVSSLSFRIDFYAILHDSSIKTGDFSFLASFNQTIMSKEKSFYEP